MFGEVQKASSHLKCDAVPTGTKCNASVPSASSLLHSTRSPVNAPICSLGKGFGEHGKRDSSQIRSGFVLFSLFCPSDPPPKGDCKPGGRTVPRPGGAELCTLLCLGFSSMSLPQTAKVEISSFEAELMVTGGSEHMS